MTMGLVVLITGTIGDGATVDTGVGCLFICSAR